MAIILDGLLGETFPSWTTATRPSSPAAGQTGYNTTTHLLEYYSGSVWGYTPEQTTLVGSPATGTINFYTSDQPVLYYTSNATGNWTLNFAASSTTSLNSLMSVGDSLTSVFIANTGTATSVNAGSFVVGTTYTITSVGTTSFTSIGASSNTVGIIFTATGVGSGTGTATYVPYQTALTIDGNAQTVKWVNGLPPTTGDVSSIDVYSYTIIKTASAVYTVLASKSKFA